MITIGRAGAHPADSKIARRTKRPYRSPIQTYSRLQRRPRPIVERITRMTRPTRAHRRCTRGASASPSSSSLTCGRARRPSFAQSPNSQPARLPRRSLDEGGSFSILLSISISIGIRHPQVFPSLITPSVSTQSGLDGLWRWSGAP